MTVGPAVVAIGGGHGLAATLQAVGRYAGAVTAIVSVADDGGSSGRLRADRPDLPAPGDVRRCLSTLADPGSVLGRTLEHRYGADAGDLAGHAFGNLLLAALARELGSFPAAVAEVARLVGAKGRVLPATSGPVALLGRVAPADRGSEHGSVVGQVAVQRRGGVDRVWLEPADAPSPVGVAEAIRAARQVVLGPGSLYTSVLAAAVVPDVLRELQATTAQRVYVANLRPELPETAGFAVADHVAALLDHGVPVDVVLAHAPDHGAIAVDAVPADGPRRVHAPLAAQDGVGHDPARLGDALAALLRTPATAVR